MMSEKEKNTTAELIMKKYIGRKLKIETKNNRVF